MSDRMPSLTALRAFEAAARHMSFAKAAEELHVTPAALSYQIKNLEADLGAPLFHRLNRAVELTEAGKALAPGLSEGFAGLSGAWQRVRRLQNDTVLTVTAGPAFTSKWLAPRMYDFAQAHPEIELRFFASLRILDLERDGVDVAIRFGLGHDAEVYSQPLAREWLTPMMTPELAARYPNEADLADAVLIHDDSLAGFNLPLGWAAWSGAVGIEIDTQHGPRFSQADHALDAALAGAGVVLGRATLASRDLLSGRLVAPYKVGLVSDPQFRFICTPGAEKRPQVAAFEAWVMDQMRELQDTEVGHHLIDTRTL